MKKSLLAVAIVASTLSTSLFAISNSEVLLDLELEKLASVHFQQEEASFVADNSLKEVELTVPLSVGVRGALANKPAKPYGIKFADANQPAGATGPFHLEANGLDPVVMTLEYTDKEGVKTDVVMNTEIDGTTINPLALTTADVAKFDSALTFTIDDHTKYDVGEYGALVRAIVVAK